MNAAALPEPLRPHAAGSDARRTPMTASSAARCSPAVQTAGEGAGIFENHAVRFGSLVGDPIYNTSRTPRRRIQYNSEL